MCFLAAIPHTSFSQNDFGIVFQFMKPNTRQTLEEVATNVLKIQNNTRQPQEVSVNISIPQGWQLFGNPAKTYTVSSGDSIFIPVRIIPSKQSEGSANYVINAFLTSSTGFQLGSEYWYIDIAKVINWTVKMPRQKIYFMNKSDMAAFEFIIENTGNSNEKIRVDFTPQRNLLLTDSAGIPQPESAMFQIKAGTDTLVKYYVKKIEERRPTTVTTASDKDMITEKYSLKVAARNEASGKDKLKLWRGNFDFYELNNEKKIEGHGYSSLPITVELNSFDVLDNTALLLDIYGSAEFNKGRSLAYRYQTNYVNNFVNSEAYIGTFHYLGYFTRLGSLELGNLSSGKQGAFIGGKGLKGTLKIKRNELSGMYVFNPQIFRPHFQTGAAVNNIFRSKKFINDTYMQHQRDEFALVNTTYAGSSTSLQISRRHYLKVMGGVSHQNHYANTLNPLNLWGYGYEVNYNGSVKKLSFGASHRNGTKTFSTYGGVTSFAGTMGYTFSEKYAISVLANNFSNETIRYSGGIRQPDPPATNRQRYEMRFALNTDGAKIIVRPYYMYQDIFRLRTAVKAMGFDYRPMIHNLDFRFYSSVEAGFIKALNTNLSNFFFMQVFGNFKYKTFATSLRYYFGPYQAIEQIRFIQTGINPQRLVISANNDSWLVAGKLQLRTNSTFNYDTYFQRIGYILRPEFFYHVGAGFTFSYYMEYLVNSQANRNSAGIAEVSGDRKVSHDFNIGAGIRKTFEIPLSRRKFHEVEIIVFKDLNGNGLLDNNEDVVENILVNIKSVSSDLSDSLATEPEKPVNYELLTDHNGKVKFINLPTGNYIIRLNPLGDTGGWFDGKEMTYTIDGKKKIAIPLIKAARISGTIALEMDKYSRYEGTVDLSRIRVTATNMAGNTFSTLTGKNGDFSIFLPIGEYAISVNQSALGDHFEFVKSEAKLNLSSPDGNYHISFYVREKKRKMNIKEFKD